MLADIIDSNPPIKLSKFQLIHSFSGLYLNDSVLKFGLANYTLDASHGIL
tara:strand:+ start:276 stop:425 length:150 start_codon:yes stop_codon:yes gene_type:complete